MDAVPLDDQCEEIKLEAAMGINGHLPAALSTTPCGGYVVYPLGMAIVLRNMATRASLLLEQHTGHIACLRISPDGTRLATGQESPGETKAEVIIWDLTQAKALCDSGKQRATGIGILSLVQHVNKVQAVDFTCDGSYVISLGGRADNLLVVWDLQTGEPCCASPAGPDTALCLRALHQRNDRFVTAGNFNFRVWEFDPQAKRIQAMDASMGKMRRIIRCLDITEDDTTAVAGTSTGEMLRFLIRRDPIKDPNEADKLVPLFQGYSREKFGMGVKSVLALTNTVTLIGGGDGTLAYINHALNTVRDHRATLLGGVTTLCRANDQREGFYAVTTESNWYYVSTDLQTELRGTCHYGAVNDICFPKNCSELFVTCSANDIRIWNTALRQEIIRIQVPSVVCHAICVTPNGSNIVSGWSDGKIRTFLPQSGKLRFVIPEAQPDGVTALALFNEECESEEGGDRTPWLAISGGMDGRIRVWAIHKSHQKMLYSLKEHRRQVTSIAISSDNASFVSSSADGSCIVWDSRDLRRVGAVFAQNIFEAALFHPDCSQILTCGTSCKLTYWDVYDSSPIRELVGGTASLNSMDVTPKGDLVLVGGEDRTLRLWSWDEGLVMAQGRGQTGSIKKVRISPDLQHVVSTGTDGSIFLWSMPARLRDMTLSTLPSPPHAHKEDLKLPPIHNLSMGPSSARGSEASWASSRESRSRGPIPTNPPPPHSRSRPASSSLSAGLGSARRMSGPSPTSSSRRWS